MEIFCFRVYPWDTEGKFRLKFSLGAVKPTAPASVLRPSNTLLAGTGIEGYLVAALLLVTHPPGSIHNRRLDQNYDLLHVNRIIPLELLFSWCTNF